MERVNAIESPRKRQKTDNDCSTDHTIVPPSEFAVQEPTAAEPAPISDGDAQALKEAQVGITEFVSAGNEGFAGILKKRYILIHQLWVIETDGCSSEP